MTYHCACLASEQNEGRQCCVLMRIFLYYFALARIFLRYCVYARDMCILFYTNVYKHIVHVFYWYLSTKFVRSWLYMTCWIAYSVAHLPVRQETAGSVPGRIRLWQNPSETDVKRSFKAFIHIVNRWPKAIFYGIHNILACIRTYLCIYLQAYRYNLVCIYSQKMW